MAHANFTNNTAGRAAAIFLLGSNATVNESYFAYNSAGSSGGAVGAALSQLAITGSRFRNNAALGYKVETNRPYEDGQVKGYGGACFFHGSNATITDVTFQGHLAFEGGALFGQDASNLTIQVSAFINNTAAAGGALSTKDGGMVVISGSHFVKNTASPGALAGSKTVIDLLVEYPQYNGFGGAIIFDSSQVNITNSTLTANKAVLDGGEALRTVLVLDEGACVGPANSNRCCFSRLLTVR